MGFSRHLGKTTARSWRISPDIRPRWNSVKGIIEKNLYLSAYATDGHYNDMDMLEIGRGLKPNEEEVLWNVVHHEFSPADRM